MLNQDDQKSNASRYIEIDGQQIPVTEEVYRAYKRPLWAEHKRMEREKRCRNADGNRCTEDCSHCDKQRTGSALSLDKFTEGGFDVADPTDFDQLIEDELVIDALHVALGELNALDRQIIDLFSIGKSERDIATIVGLSQKGVNKRKTRIFADLRHRLKSFL